MGFEIEMVVADGFAVELELPLIDTRVVQYKMGLQGKLGTFRGGRGIHGVQYLGLYDRESGEWQSTLLWLLGNRFGERWSTMTMLGVGDVTLREGNRTGFVVNHSTFTTSIATRCWAWNSTVRTATAPIGW